MTLEGHFCWEDCDEGPHGCICGNDCPPPPLPLDPYPWRYWPPYGQSDVQEVRYRTQLDGFRDSQAAGSILFRPREGYSQNREDYAS